MPKLSIKIQKKQIKKYLYFLYKNDIMIHSVILASIAKRPNNAVQKIFWMICNKGGYISHKKNKRSRGKFL